MEEIIILIVSISSGLITYIVTNFLKKGPVIGSAIVTLTAGLMFPYFFPSIGDKLAIAAACASYAGVVSIENALNLMEMAVISLMTGILFLATSSAYVGIGGRLGTIAAISCFAWLGFKKVFSAIDGSLENSLFKTWGHANDKGGVKFMKINKTKLITYSGMIALLASMIVGLVGFSNSTNDINDIKNRLLTTHLENDIHLSMKYLHNHYGKLTQGNETLLDNEGKSIEGSFGVVDSVLEDLGNKSTIFVRVNDDFKRISTNIMHDNERAVGTFLGPNHKAYQTVIKGDLYIGEAEILGENYYTAYDPIKDNNNNVIGLLFVGTPTEELDNIINTHDTKMSNINILIIVLRTISLGALIALVTASVVGRKYNIDE